MQHNTFIIDWLEKRKITKTVIDDFGLYSGTHYLLGECIVIPVMDQEGNFLFNKYRRHPLSEEGSKYVYDKGASVALYGVDKMKGKNTILITEGELDALAAWSCNIPAVSSTGGSLSFQDSWISLFIGKEVIVCFDNDQPGGNGMARVIHMLPHAKMLFLPDRPGIKDISDYVQQGGDLHNLIQSAISFDGMESVMQHRAERIALWQSTFFHDAYIEMHTPKPVQKSTHTYEKTDDRLENAKRYPISNLIKINKEGKAKCLWHNEKTESMHYYPDTNKCYCFGQCGRVYDSIDVYRQLHNCSFLEALNKLQ